MLSSKDSYYDGQSESRHLNSVPWNSKATLPDEIQDIQISLNFRSIVTFFGSFSNVLYLLKFFFFFKISLFLSLLGLCCCEWAFSSFRERGLSSSCGAGTSQCGGFSCCGPWA